ncbi:hypothetical protein [Massilia glaciei]|uniref:DUF3060 domain-containing protein n=1 Tax=Massilia glaciei TaxID=1524097 RepID=A0A2U2HMH0_9BURK|nr:hypothetical protein [Massilia glaciei]PWF48697.1 hypothetical protein C7C56_010330 [Massilia glaciei]
MKTKITNALVALLVAGASGGIAMAQSTSRGEVKDASVKVSIKNSNLTTISGQGTASMVMRGMQAELGKANIEVGNITACGGSKVANVNVDVKLDQSNLTATGSTRIGNVSAGCN